MGDIDPGLRRAALAPLLLGFAGARVPAWLGDALADGLGGVVLFATNTGADVAALTASLRAAAGRDVVVALDEEGGEVTRLDALRGSRSPGAGALGHLDDATATEGCYRRIGERCATAGATLDLAPVADVNTDARNPVIGLRAFSADPDVASRHVAAAVRGLQAGGVAACAKHFPGHGATATDSHRRVAVLDRSRADLDAVELAPFRAAIGAGTRAVMTGHLLVPSLDPDNLATTSAAITTRLLRDELCFTGTVLTDALEMGAITDSPADAFVAALVAGADAIEFGAGERPGLVDAIPTAVAAAVRDGRLSTARLEDAAMRTARLARPATTVTTTAAEDGLAARCLQVSGPLPALHLPLVIECRTAANLAAGAQPWSLGERLAVPGTEVIATDTTIDIAGTAEPGRSLVLVVRDPQLRTWQQPMIAAAAAHPDAVVVDVGWPAALPDVPFVRTRGIAPVLLQAAAGLLTAGFSPTAPR